MYLADIAKVNTLHSRGNRSNFGFLELPNHSASCKILNHYSRYMIYTCAPGTGPVRGPQGLYPTYRTCGGGTASVRHAQHLCVV